MASQQLIAFITEARKRGFSDGDIRKPLFEQGWSAVDITQAFAAAKNVPRNRNQVCIYLDSAVLHVLEKRAKKNMLSLPEQIEDIVRRSAANSRKGAPKPEKLDDLLVTVFSRKKKTKH